MAMRWAALAPPAQAAIPGGVLLAAVLLGGISVTGEQHRQLARLQQAFQRHQQDEARWRQQLAALPELTELQQRLAERRPLAQQPERIETWLEAPLNESGVSLMALAPLEQASPGWRLALHADYAGMVKFIHHLNRLAVPLRLDQLLLKKDGDGLRVELRLSLPAAQEEP